MGTRSSAQCRQQRHENKTRSTFTRTTGKRGARISGAHSEAAPPCPYIEAGTWEAGAPPYCGRPARPGSSYCAFHAPLCGVDPASDEGIRIAKEQDLAARDGAPEEATPFSISVVPEPFDGADSVEPWELAFAITGEAEEQ